MVISVKRNREPSPLWYTHKCTHYSSHQHQSKKSCKISWRVTIICEDSSKDEELPHLRDTFRRNWRPSISKDLLGQLQYTTSEDSPTVKPPKLRLLSYTYLGLVGVVTSPLCPAGSYYSSLAV